MTTVTRPLRFEFQSRRKRATTAPVPLALAGGAAGQPAPSTATPAPTAGRVPRISRLMALAIRFDGLLRDGVVTSQSELAALARVTQPRMTQIMNLLHLAPDIQEELLFLESLDRGREVFHERHLRLLTAVNNWRQQRAAWENMKLGSHNIARGGQ